MLANLPPIGDTCTLCGKFIPAVDIRKLDGERSRCPHCGGDYTTAIHPRWSQLSR